MDRDWTASSSIEGVADPEGVLLAKGLREGDRPRTDLLDPCRVKVGLVSAFDGQFGLDRCVGCQLVGRSKFELSPNDTSSIHPSCFVVFLSALAEGKGGSNGGVLGDGVREEGGQLACLEAVGVASLEGAVEGALQPGSIRGIPLLGRYRVYILRP